MKNVLKIALFTTSTLFLNPAHSDEMQVIENSVSWSPDLYENFSPVPGFTKTLSVTEDSHLFISGHIDTHHRGISNTEKKAVMVAFKVKINGSWLAGSTTGENIVGTEDHYYSAQIHGYKLLKPGSYTIEVHGRSASTAAPGVNGLAEVKGGYNHVIYKVLPKSKI